MTTPLGSSALPRRHVRLSALSLSVSLAAGLTVALAPAAPAQAGSCTPTPSHLTRLTPVHRSLACGVSLRAWDTGPTPSKPRASTRIVAVKIPPASALRPKVVAAGSLTAAATTSQMASRDAGAIVTVNGDFFDPARRGLPIHAQMRGGVVQKAHAQGSHMVVVGHDGKLRLDRLSTRGSVTIGTSSHAVQGLNWQSVGTGLAVYTPAFGGQRRPYGTVDVVVAGKVQAVRTGTARGAAIVAGQTILTANATLGTALSKVRVGTPVSFAYGARSGSGLVVRDAPGVNMRRVDRAPDAPQRLIPNVLSWR